MRGGRIPIGIDDFRKIREERMEYVDKSLLIRDVLNKGAEVLLLPRPRRFGKSLNLSMLRCFLEKSGEDLSRLFAGLAIEREGACKEHFRRYPTIYLTFKSIKSERWEHALAAIRQKITDVFNQHRYVLDTNPPSEVEARRYRSILDGTATPEVYESSLLLLSGVLQQHHGERVVILIDEYDEPLHAGWVNGYGREAITFFRAFLNEGLKGNPHLFKAVLTGVLRIAKESIFSGLNNLAVYSLIERDFSTAFGFTEDEVAALLESAGRRDELDVARAWYNGYVFGDTVIYNPWSILNFIDRGGDPRGYWVSTSSNDLVREALIRHAVEAEDDIATLLEGGQVERRLEENVSLPDLATRTDTLFSLLTFSGYLRAEKRSMGPGEEPVYRLSIPNREVRQVYTSTFREWMQARLRGGARGVERLTKALLSGDAEALEEELQAFTESVLSYHDTALRPEQVYHAFVIGLLASMDPAYEVRSNRESGKGRPDVIRRPKRAGEPGALLELKVAKAGKTTVEQALAAGLAQIAARDYAAELRAAGASPVFAYAVAFDGKTVRVQAA